MSRLVRYVAVLTGVLLVAGVVLEERDASYQFRTTFGVNAPKTVADRIRLAPLVFRELERTVEEMATFCVASEAAANRPLRQGETEEALDKQGQGRPQREHNDDREKNCPTSAKRRRISMNLPNIVWHI